MLDKWNHPYLRRIFSRTAESIRPMKRNVNVSKNFFNLTCSSSRLDKAKSEYGNETFWNSAYEQYSRLAITNWDWMFYYSVRFKTSFLKFVLTQVSTLISKIFISVHRGSVRSRSGSTFVQRERAPAEHSFVRW